MILWGILCQEGKINRFFDPWTCNSCKKVFCLANSKSFQYVGQQSNHEMAGACVGPLNPDFLTPFTVHFIYDRSLVFERANYRTHIVT